jgi:DNA polymerase III epsilon subunit-like protein
MIDFQLWLEETMLNTLKTITEDICNKIQFDAYIQMAKTNDSCHIVDKDYMTHYINKLTHQLNQQVSNSLPDHTLYIKSNKYTKSLIHLSPIKYPHINNTLLDTAKQIQLYTSFKEFEHPFQLAFLDLETDGLDIQSANILQISFIKIQIEEGSITPFIIQDIITTYVKPYEEYTVNENNPSFKINKITQQDIDQAPLFKHIASTIADGSVMKTIVGFNIHQFDIPILKRHLQKFGEKPGWTHTIDIAQAFWKYYPSTLTNALKTLGIKDTFQTHNAKDDNIACIHIFESLIQSRHIPDKPKDFLNLVHQDANKTRRSHIIEENHPSHPWIGDNYFLSYYDHLSTKKKRPLHTSIMPLSKKIKV